MEFITYSDSSGKKEPDLRLREDRQKTVSFASPGDLSITEF